MRRLACVDLPNLPLQILLRRNPRWRGEPAAVVAEDKALAPVQWVNEEARAQGIRPGLRYSAALNLDSSLRAGVVPPGEVSEALLAVVEALRPYSPSIVPVPSELSLGSGALWLDVSGLERLHPKLEEWAKAVVAALGELELRAVVVVGFSAFGSLALARSGSIAELRVLSDAEQEQAEARAVDLSRLGLVSDELETLGVRSLGELLDLPADGLGERYGRELLRLHRRARGEGALPLRALDPALCRCRRAQWDFPDGDAASLLFRCKALLDPLLELARTRQELVQEIQLEFVLDLGGRQEERVLPAAPTIDGAQLLELLRLRLEALALSSGAVELALSVSVQEADRCQPELFVRRPRRDLKAAERALARVRAELGQDAVLRAELRSRVLPEDRVAWRVWSGFSRKKKGEEKQDGVASAPPGMVRRLISPPRRLPAPMNSQGQGLGPAQWRSWRPLGLAGGGVTEMDGPYLLSDGWWTQSEARRAYYYLHMRGGEILWVFFDGKEWYLHGEVA